MKRSHVRFEDDPYRFTLVEYGLAALAAIVAAPFTWAFHGARPDGTESAAMTTAVSAPPLRIYVWEGNGISDAYHDDGTLVVLAESPEQARETVRQERDRREAAYAEWERERDRLMAALDHPEAIWKTDEGRAHWATLPERGSNFFDGSDGALDREPDRVIELDGPKWVAFNGGGYD